MKSVKEIRSEYLSFFEKQGHTIVPSSPLVPMNDPTVMFTMAGMMQFKNVFTGLEKRDYTRAVSSQKCVRAGGKHNDLENVGYTARHLTFFEMLGNFSFGDYFKEEAIAYGWDLVTNVFGLPKDRLLVTVHTSDEESATIWKKVAGLSDDKIIRIPTDDNFWSMGDTGPCGPCTEIFFDHGEGIFGGPPGSPDEDGDRFVEIWNIVFMQFEKLENGDRIDLPKPSVDTGMGLERMATVLQGKHSLFETDLLRSIIEHCADLTGIDPDGDQAASHKVVSDHLRSSAFLIADGVMPGSEGRGYVLRRIMRRGMRHAHLLGAKEPLMYRLMPTLVSMMGEAYPELKRAESMITETLKLEETRFRNTLDRGLKLLEEESAKLPKGAELSGEVAFKLYDTFGFPVDLTQDALRAKDISVDMNRFDECMEQQRADARRSWAGSGGEATDKLWFEILEQFGGTEFLGYQDLKAEGQIKALVKDSAKIETAKEGETVFMITNQSPFYAESGGQVGDQGILETASGAKVNVLDTKKQLGKLWVHIGLVESGEISVGDIVNMQVNEERRAMIQSNHSATHLLHEALRRVLGDHVAQKGSLQDDERTRFDISHNTPIAPEQLEMIENQINEEIRANTSVETRVLPLEEAMESGATALFGEKYEDEVRVVSMGTQKEGGDKPFSVELCGGTHVKSTGQIGLLKIVSQSAVSAGVRRIEAVTGKSALNYFTNQEQELQNIADLLKVPSSEAFSRVENLITEKKKLEQELSNLRREMATGGSAAGKENSEVKSISGIPFTARVLDNFPAKDLKSMVDDIKKKLGSAVVTLVSTNEGKASIVIGVTEDLTGKVSAVELVKIGAEALGGKGGGGRPDMAQAGGPNADAANDAISAIESALGA